MAAGWEESEDLLRLAFLRHPKPIRRRLYPMNPLERSAKWIKWWTKGVEVFCGEEAAEQLL
ncbi:hypothetical protein [Thermoflexus sp.]|uniref:hypothetical protein n=1 Tax=Thermoflexus sp. TaxID=1969742 RepID=UPI0035E406BF